MLPKKGADGRAAPLPTYVQEGTLPPADWPGWAELEDQGQGELDAWLVGYDLRLCELDPSKVILSHEESGLEAALPFIEGMELTEDDEGISIITAPNMDAEICHDIMLECGKDFRSEPAVTQFVNLETCIFRTFRQPCRAQRAQVESRSQSGPSWTQSVTSLSRTRKRARTRTRTRTARRPSLQVPRALPE